SGCDVATVNRFIKQFTQMQKMMKQMGGMSGKRRGRNPLAGMFGGGMPQGNMGRRRGGFPF
ncbi:MAG TPA: signal recognition particle protein, partial [Sarcina sp.]|nr:signal recognition particle protein [Sarcina sp.]